MQTSSDERARLSSLRRYDILDTPREQAFDDLVEIAAQIAGTPMAVMNLIDADRQWSKASTGIESDEAPYEESFCVHTVRYEDELMTVPDTHEDPFFRDHPAVLGDPNVRFYAGAQITDAEGYKLGALCVIDRVPRELDEDQKRALAALGRQAMAQMELRLSLRAERDRVSQLQELDRMRDQFVSTISHELRTPLTSIRGWLDLLLEESEMLDPGHADALSRIGRNTDRLIRVVSDLLDLQKVDSGDLSIRSEQVDLSACVRDAVHAIETGDAAAKLTIVADVADGVSVTGDASRLSQVIDNLCSNAVKYTPAGGDVNISLHQRGDSVVLRVADSGIGIPAEEREHLFERFFRASTATERDIKGTGLGLAVSKAIVERHGGSIEVAAGERGGTAFVVELPVSPPR
jgi:signal transduction histidine kinase